MFQRIPTRTTAPAPRAPPGYEASADYVAGRLRAAGYTVTEQEFVLRPLRLGRRRWWRPDAAGPARLGTDRGHLQPVLRQPGPGHRFDGRSDYGPFIAVGIPAGDLFSGAEGEKTAEEAAIYGGTAGQPYDPCYHQACDTINNLSTKALNELGTVPPTRS